MYVDRDIEHLKLLGVLHYVLGGLTGVWACIPCIHLFIGIMIVTNGFGSPANGPPPALGWFFVAIALALILLGWTLAALLLIAGGCLRKQRHYIFCFVVAAISCLQMPLGTVLGIFTIIVLVRPRVKQLFQGPFPAAVPLPPNGK